MTKKIFHSILLVAGTVLLASLLVIMGCLYEYFGSVEKKQLRDELELAAVAVEKNGTEYLSQLSSERYRLTWIENDGTVLYDTVTDAESLENFFDIAVCGVEEREYDMLNGNIVIVHILCDLFSLIEAAVYIGRNINRVHLSAAARYLRERCDLLQECVLYALIVSAH